MAQSDYSLKLSSTEYLVKPIPGSYTGYYYGDEITVQKLLGKDGGSPDKNEILQSTSKGGKQAILSVYATTAEKDLLIGLMWQTVTHDDGIDAGEHTVVVMSVISEVYHKTGTSAAIHKVTLKLREK